MAKAIFLAVALVLAWLSVAHGQALDLYLKSDATYVAEQRTNSDGNPQNNWLLTGYVNPYTANEATSDLYRYLGRNRNRDIRNGGSYNYNPYLLYKW